MPDFMFGQGAVGLILPCKNEERVVQQVQPTIHLLSNMDVLHPDILRQHSIDPADYKSGLVFRSAVESIRGRFIASSTIGREAFVRHILDNLQQQGKIADYTQSSSSGRYDFTIAIEHDPDYFAALEVKGGEGNSINISERPLWAKEFGVWCFLDGAVVNQPANGARAIISRLTNELVRRGKLVDVLFFRDTLCGTRARPCPKYPGQENDIGVHTAPDIFLFPQAIPSSVEPEPPIHTVDTLKLPKRILEIFNIPLSALYQHIWEVHIKFQESASGQYQHVTQVLHQGYVVSQSVSKAWRS